MRLARRLGIMGAIVALGLGIAAQPAQASPESKSFCAYPFNKMALCMKATGDHGTAYSEGSVTFDDDFYTSARACYVITWMTLRGSDGSTWDSPPVSASCNRALFFYRGEPSSAYTSTGTSAQFVKANACLDLYWELGRPPAIHSCAQSAEWTGHLKG
jgi:hypothetical protein